MLSQVYIKNFAIVDELNIDMFDGFTVISGETGAGKSLIIDALSLLLGKSAGEHWIKFGCDTAVVSALFKFKKMPQELIDYQDDMTNEILVTKRITRNGSSRLSVNGKPATLKFVKSVFLKYVVLVSQADSHNMLNQNYYLDVLDSFAKTRSLNIYQQYLDSYQKYLEIKSGYDLLLQKNQEVNKNIDYIEFQINDIESMGFTKGEEETLIEQKKIYKTSGKLLSTYKNIKTGLAVICDTAQEIESDLEKLEIMPKELLPLRDNIHQLSINAVSDREDISQLITNFLDVETIDINQIESRLDEIFKYKLKYKVNNLDELLMMLDAIKQQLHDVQHDTDSIAKQRKELTKIEEEVLVLSESLSKHRKSHLVQFQTFLNKQFHDLDLKNSKIEISLSDTDQFYQTGKNKIDFNVCMNLGDDYKPLDQIASGGELSRVLLALQVILIDDQDSKLVIFDELDVGVSGVTANKIAQKLKIISTKSQLICITHLPQIAKSADKHYVVTKFTENESTKVKIELLNDDDNKKEIIRMLGGFEISDMISSSN